MAKSAQIKKMSTRHEAILNYILANPTCKLGDVAGEFGVTPAWLSTIIWSHAFQDQLARRQDELFDVAVVQDLGTKLSSAANMVLDEYMDKIPNMTADQLISSGDKLLGRLGFGSKGTVVQGDVIQNNSIQHNHVAPDVLAEARERIGSVKVKGNGQDKVGEADSPSALPNPKTPRGSEIEGVVVREEGEPSPDGKVRSLKVHSEPLVPVQARAKTEILPD